MEGLSMIGPKLDARSYAILILAVIGVLVGGTLVAQQQTRDYSVNAELASATRAVADATSRVAHSNAQIAAAILELGASVRDASRNMSRSGGGTAASGEAVPGEESMSAPVDNAAPEAKKPVFELN